MAVADSLLQLDFNFEISSVISKGVQPIQDQLSVLGADILNIYYMNFYYGRSFNYSQPIQLSPK